MRAIMITHVARPKTVTEAVRAGFVPGAAYLGGGTWLNSGRAGPITPLISLEHPGLGQIHADSNRCLIGAAANFQSISDSAAVPSGLRDAVRLTASRTLRNMVTIGGELGLHPADSAVIPLLIAMKADVTLAGRRKPVPIQALGNDNKAGLILSVSIPLRPTAAVRALSRTSHGPRFLVAAMCGERVVLSDCQGQTAVTVEAVTFDPRPDQFASADYKRYMVGVLLQELRGALEKEPAR